MPAFLNPDAVHKPIGAYSHTVLVAAGTELVFVAGQVGIRKDGTTPNSFAEQAEIVFENLRACLAAHGLEMKDVVKLNTYLVAGQDVQAMRAIRQSHFGMHQPTSTAIYVPALVSPELLLEVEAVAARPSP